MPTKSQVLWVQRISTRNYSRTSRHWTIFSMSFSGLTEKPSAHIGSFWLPDLSTSIKWWNVAKSRIKCQFVSCFWNKYSNAQSNAINVAFCAVVLRDMKYDHVVRIVKYLYSGKVQVPANELDEFFRIARELKILGLSYGNRRNGGTTDTCVTFLLNSVESDRENQVTPSTIDQRDAEQPSTSQQAQQPRAADDTGDPFPVTPSRLLNAPDRMQARTPVSRISPPSQFTTSTPDSNSVIMTTAGNSIHFYCSISFLKLLLLSFSWKCVAAISRIDDFPSKCRKH